MTLTPTYVKLPTPDTTPMAIGISYNELMKRWDINLTMGNFTTEEEARSAAAFLWEMTQREFGMVEGELAQ